jgi:XTP/dITP diphosphohydrolase
MELVFATNNWHKLTEIAGMLDDRFRVLGLSDIGCSEELPEEGETLEANATQKAFYLYNKYGYDCFADDTGLEVEALGGKPGVYSARYAGPGRNSEDNMTQLLEQLSEIKDRRARFRTVISLIVGGKELLFEGVAEGVILEARRGSGGFGYDPVFLPEGYDRTFAELSPEEKNIISHRGKAFRKMVAYLLGGRELPEETKL